MPLINRQLRLKTRPDGLVQRDDFDLVKQSVPALQDGEVLVQVLYLSEDPTQRVWMRDVPQYLPPVAIGEVIRAVLSRMVIGGREVLCGLISGYNSGGRPSDDFSPFVMKRLSMRGFLVLDYTKTREAVGAIGGWIREGKIKAEETVAEGLENAPVVLNRLFDGSHRGKLVLRV